MKNIYQFLDYRTYIAEVFRQRQTRNPSYSLRAFARDLGITASLVWKILNQQDAVSVKTALTIAGALRLDEAETEFLLELVRVRKSGDYTAIHKILEIREFRVAKLKFEDAYRLAFDDFAVFIKISLYKKLEPTLEGAKLIGRDPEELWEACDRLAAAGYIEGNREQGWTTDITHVVTDDEKLAANREYHRQYLMHVVEAFHKAPEERFFYTTFRSICQEDYALFCERIQEALTNTRITDTLESKDNMTYLLGVQLIPFEDVRRIPLGTVVVASALEKIQ